MNYSFFYISAAVLWILFLLLVRSRDLRLSHIIIGITTAAISLAYDTILGEVLGLYHYINTTVSPVYLVLGGIFIYPVLNMVFVIFLPQRKRIAFAYTSGWIIAMLLFEYASLITKTVVFTGWEPFPWSFVTYVVTYAWIIPFYRYMHLKRNI